MPFDLYWRRPKIPESWQSAGFLRGLHEDQDGAVVLRLRLPPPTPLILDLINASPVRPVLTEMIFQRRTESHVHLTRAMFVTQACRVEDGNILRVIAQRIPHPYPDHIDGGVPF